MHTHNSAVHNLAVALLALDSAEAPGGDEGPLLAYLEAGGRAAGGGGRPLYDPKYALRVARDRDR